MRRCCGDTMCPGHAWLSAGLEAVSRKSRQSGLLQWLRFIGRFHDPVPRTRWQKWLDAYGIFYEVLGACGLHQSSGPPRPQPIFIMAVSRSTLRWDSVPAEDLRRYVALRCRVLSPKSVNDILSILRQFLRFMHLRGECSPRLVLAVPTAADFGHQRLPGSSMKASGESCSPRLTAVRRRSTGLFHRSLFG